MCHSICVFFYALLICEVVLILYGMKGSELMANLKQAKTQDEIKKLTVNNVKKAYNDLAIDYNHLLDLDFVYCPKCGKWKSAKAFYSSTENVDGIEHYACKECILNLCTDVNKDGTRIDNREKTIDTFRRLDWYFSDKDYKAQLESLAEGVGEKIRSTAAQQFIVMVRSLPQYRNLHYSDSEFDIDDLDNNTEENTRIVQKTLKSAKKRFGNNYNKEELMFLETEYQDWTTRYPCENKSQELLFKRVCCKELEIDNAQKNGKDTKDLDATLQNLLGSLNIKPNQKTSSELTDNLTFGQLIDKWEGEWDGGKPIPEPEGEFKDPDKIGLLIDVFFKGHLSKMMGLKNAFSAIYEKFISKYTVKKPEYDEDTDSEALFDKIFGQKADEEV